MKRKSSAFWKQGIKIKLNVGFWRFLRLQPLLQSHLVSSWQLVAMWDTLTNLLEMFLLSAVNSCLFGCWFQAW